MVQENDLSAYRQQSHGELSPSLSTHLSTHPSRHKTMIDQALCPIEVAARIIGQKWTLQIVYTLIDCEPRRFCELQEALGGVNPSTLSSRLKMLEEEGLVQRIQVSALPPHVEYRLTDMGKQLEGVLKELVTWSTTWLCISESY